MHTQRHQLIKTLSNAIGKQIPVVENAAAISLDGNEFFLEFPQQAPVYIIHQSICSINSLGVNHQQMETILHLNSRLDILHCGWLGFHKSSNSLRYFATVPKALATAESLLDIMRALEPVKKRVLATLKL